jgi:hypothetical protein
MLWFYFNVLVWKKSEIHKHDLIGGTDTLTFFLNLSKPMRKQLFTTIHKSVRDIMNHVLFFEGEKEPNMSIFISHYTDDGPVVLQCKIGIKFSFQENKEITLQQLWDNSQRALVDVTSDWNRLSHSFGSGSGFEFNLDLHRICWDQQIKNGTRQYECIESMSTPVRRPSVLQYS